MAERKKGEHIKWEDRLQIQGALRSGAKPAEIAKTIGCCRATIYNEINRGMCIQQHDAEFVEEYCADVAERKYQENLRAKGPDLKLGSDFALAEYIETKIVIEHYSPGAALAAIQEEGLTFDTEICENTLYNYIYRGDVFLTLTKEHLLYKGKRHKPDPEKHKRSRTPNGESIEKRDPEVKERTTFGHWEMDSIMGCRGSKAALVVLTERLTRYGLVFRVPDHTMGSVVKVLDRLERKMGKDFQRIFQTITVDNGSEFQDWEGMTRAVTGDGKRTRIYYCHPYSAFERGSNENGNRMIRRKVPKRTDFTGITEAETLEVQRWVNEYPRGILGGRCAGQVMPKLVQETGSELLL